MIIQQRNLKQQSPLSLTVHQPTRPQWVKTLTQNKLKIPLSSGKPCDSSIFGAFRSHHLTSGGELPLRVSPSTRTISKEPFGFRRFVCLWITLVFACLGLQVEAAPVSLPLEVIGAQGTEVSATLTLSAGQASASQRLWLQTHNLRYAEKGSVRINGGAWVALNNTNATMLGTSQTYGGIGGAIAVLKMTLPLAAGQMVTGDNTITFRFNQSNGLSTGYRIVNLNLLNSAGTKLMAASELVQQDPATWVPPSSAPADIAAGENLWRNQPLVENYLPGAQPIQAKCASCHTQNGADLKYFNYSNHSIIERSKFHGLTTVQGSQVASYIRNLSVKAVGRPWNPPYQPGPGLTAKPNDEWLAGAGIDNVLDDDSDTLLAMFPNGVRRDALMEGDTNKFKRFSSHDTPLAFQLPDWNHWLPERHPLDSYPTLFPNSSSTTVYNNLRSQLVGKTPAQIHEWMRTSSNNSTNPTGLFLLRKFYADYNFYFADQLFPTQRTADARYRDPAIARGIYSFALWKMVKHVEINEEFGLTSLGKVPEGTDWAGYESRDALPRMWLGTNRTIFDSSPFLSGLEDPVTGSLSGNNQFNYSYISNSWYQLQLILNAGQRTGFNHQVVDFGYAFQFTNGFERATNFTQMGRHYVWCLKGMDEGDNDRGPNQNDGWSFNRATLAPVMPYISMDKPGGPAISPHSRAALSLLVQVWLEKNNSWLPEQIFAYADGTPKSGNEDGVQFDLRTWRIGSGSNEYQARSIGQGTFSDMGKIKTQNTLPPALLNGYAQWAQVIWPGLDANGVAQNNWMQFVYPRVGTAPAAPTLQNAATCGDIRVSWTPAAGVTSYNVKRSTSAAGPFLTVAYFRTSGEYTDSVPLQNQEYYYKLSANTASGESPDSPATLSNLLRNRLLGTFIGTTPSNGEATREATDGDRHTIAFAYASGSWAGLDLGSTQPITRIGFVPQRAYSKRSIGGKFQASNAANFSSGVVDLYTISTDPGDGFKQYTISVPGKFRYVRYLLPTGNGAQGQIAEITFWDDTEVAPTVSALSNASVSAGGNVSLSATVNGSPYPALQWQRAAIGSSNFSNLSNSGAYSGVTSDSLSISGATLSMSGDRFRLVATNLISTVISNEAALTVTPAPPPPIKLTGTVIGTTGSWNNGGNTRDKAFDGNTASFFDAATANGNWVGLDLGTAQVITQVRYFPRSDHASRMSGGIFQGSNSADFSSGVTNLHTISGIPPVAYTTTTVSISTSFRYVRYLSPNDGYGNVAEVEFYRAAAPVITSALTRTATVGTAISNYTITASNSPTSYNASNLPAGLSVNTSTGVISGTPTTAGSVSTTISATNTGGTGSATLVFTISSAPTGLTNFRTAHNLALNGSQDLLSPANDGVANLLKYAFNMIGGEAGQVNNLMTPNSATLQSNGAAGLPFVSVNVTGKLQITFIRRKAASNSGITYAVEFTDSLATGSWAVNPDATEISPTINDTLERVTVTDSEAAINRFARVRVTGN